MALFHISVRDGHAYVRGMQHDVHFTYQVSLGGLQVLAEAGVRDGDEIPPDVYETLDAQNLLYTKGSEVYKDEPRTKIDHDGYDRMVERLAARRTAEASRQETENREGWSRWIRALASNAVRESRDHSTMWLVLARYAETAEEEAYCIDEFVRLQPLSRLADEALQKLKTAPRRLPAAVENGPWRLGPFPECKPLASRRVDVE